MRRSLSRKIQPEKLTSIRSPVLYGYRRGSNFAKEVEASLNFANRVELGSPRQHRQEVKTKLAPRPGCCLDLQRMNSSAQSARPVGIIAHYFFANIWPVAEQPSAFPAESIEHICTGDQMLHFEFYLVVVELVRFKILDDSVVA